MEPDCQTIAIVLASHFLPPKPPVQASEFSSRALSLMAPVADFATLADQAVRKRGGHFQQQLGDHDESDTCPTQAKDAGGR
jgi:hypothetical protein